MMTVNRSLLTERPDGRFLSPPLSSTGPCEPEGGFVKK
jgi:hypothetical protein